MSVTAKLVKVFLVDNQLRGLKGRLNASEQVLSDQGKLAGELETERKTLDALLKITQAQAANFEGETKRLDERIEKIKEQMNVADTQKVYQAFLTEVNTFKLDRDKAETSAIELLSKIDGYKKQLEAVEVKRAEREKMATVARGNRDQRAEEIKSKVESLTTERATLATEVPADVLKEYERTFKQRGEDTVAIIEMQSRKDMEFTCAGCMMHIPVDTINGLLASGKITRCSSCHCYLYVADELAKTLSEPAPKGRGKKAAESL